MMRAYAIDKYGGIENLRLRELDTPSVSDDGVLVRVQAAALNPADWKVLTGREGGKFLHARKFPLVLGFDFSGMVEEAGSSARDVSVGEAVFGFLPYSRKNRQGSFAQYVSVPAAAVGPKPSQVSHVEAACSATAASTALQALRDKGGLNAGQRVLINGASGGVGSYAVQIAKNAGAEVWGTCSASKVEHVEALGADHTVDYRTTPVAEIKARFDIILDAASTSSFGACSAILNPGGTYVTLLPSFGLLTGMVRATFSSKRCKVVVVQSRRDDLKHLAGLMAEQRLRHPVDATYPLEKLPDALRYMQSGTGVGKVAIAVDH